MEQWLLISFSNIFLSPRYFSIVVPSRRPPTSTAPLSSRAITNLPRPEERLGPCKYPPPHFVILARYPPGDLERGVSIAEYSGHFVLWIFFHSSSLAVYTCYFAFAFFFSFPLYFTFSFAPFLVLFPFYMHNTTIRAYRRQTDIDSHIQNTHPVSQTILHEKNMHLFNLQAS